VLREEEFDIIHLESLFCAPMLPVIRRHSEARAVLRAHNVEHVIWQRLARGERNPLKRMYLSILAERLRAEELRLLSQVDGIATITREDTDAFRALGVNVPMRTVPMALPISGTEPHPVPPGPLSLYHLGSMDWQPNVEGVAWFIREVWPLLHRELPGLTCHLAGRGMPAELIAHHAPPLHVQGEVASVDGFARGHAIAIVPLLSGSGMRIKIVEALAMGKVVISTTVGAEGIPYSDGVDLLIADTPQQFLDRLRSISLEKKKLNAVSAAARKLAEGHFDIGKVTGMLETFYSEGS